MKNSNFEQLLKRMDIEFKRVEVLKNNGIMKKGYKLKFEDNNHICPTIYDEMIYSNDEVTMFREIEEMRLESMNKVCDLDDLLSNSGWFETRLRVAVRNREINREDEDTVRTVCEKPFDDLEEYYYLHITADDRRKLGINCDYDGMASIKITNEMLKQYKYTKEWVRAKARKNSREEIVIKGMHEEIMEICEVPFDEEIPLAKATNEFMWVISNKNKTLGAVGILFMDIIKDFATEHNIKRFVILPSSIHEILLAKLDKFENASESVFENMVKEVNETQVDEIERLSNKAYIINNE